MCGAEFILDKYHPQQKGCKNPECCKQRQRHRWQEWYKKKKKDLVYINKKKEYSSNYYQMLKQGLV